MRNKKGQSILEYVIVLTVIIAAIIAGVNTAFKGRVQKGIENSGSVIENATNKILNITDSTPAK